MRFMKRPVNCVWKMGPWMSLPPRAGAIRKISGRSERNTAQGLDSWRKWFYDNPGDVIVPFSKIPEMMKELKRLEEKI